MIPRTRGIWLVVLLAWCAWLGLEQPWKGDAHARTAAKVGLLFPQLSSQLEDIAKIVIVDGPRKATLEVTDESSPYGPGRWLVKEKGHPADGARLARLADGLANLKTIDVVAAESSNHGTYGVAEGQGTRVQLFDDQGELVVDWIAGKIRDQDVRQGQKVVFEYYMRDGRRPEVYLSADPVQPPTDAIDWCDTSFLAMLDPETVTAIERQDFRGGDSWRIERVDQLLLDAEGVESPWRLRGDPEEVGLSFAVDSLLFTLTGLRAADIVGGRRATPTEEDARYGFPQDRFLIEVGDQVLTLDLGKPATDGQRYLRLSGLPHLYTLKDFDVTQLRQSPARLVRRDG